MAEPNIQESGASRRRSMLPQLSTKNCRKPTVNPTPLPEQDEPDTENGIATTTSLGKLQRLKASTKPSLSAMPPPSNIPKTRSSKIRPTPMPEMTSSLRRTSSVKGSTLDPVKAQSKPGLDGTKKRRSDSTRGSPHGRSFSQQIRSASVSGSLPQLSRSSLSRKTSMKQQKPAFSAMQQKFSPEKVSNGSFATQALNNNTEVDFDVGPVHQLQVNLAQLHLMHRSAVSVQLQWERSAKGCLQSRFDDLRMRHTELKEISHQQQVLLNQVALVEWCQGKPSTHVAEKVQQLSQNIEIVHTLLDSEGKYTHIIEIFESWFAQARRIRESRDSGAKTMSKDLEFVEGIGDGWKAEAMVLERELTYCSRDVKAFGEVRITSSLGRMLSLYRALVTSLEHELDVIQWIENEVMLQESTWMDETVHKLSANVNQAILP